MIWDFIAMPLKPGETLPLRSSFRLLSGSHGQRKERHVRQAGSFPGKSHCELRSADETGVGRFADVCACGFVALQEALGCRQNLGNDIDFTRGTTTSSSSFASTAPSTTNWRPYASHVHSLVSSKWPTGSTLPSVHPEERVGG